MHNGVAFCAFAAEQGSRAGDLVRETDDAGAQLTAEEVRLATGYRSMVVSPKRQLPRLRCHCERGGRAKSLITMAQSVLNTRAKPERMLAALASGSVGRTSTLWPVSSTFERSMPAFAEIKPSICSTTNTFCAWREMLRLWRKISSTKAASLLVSAANCCARSLTTTRRKSTKAPSALETILEEMTNTSPD